MSFLNPDSDRNQQQSRLFTLTPTPKKSPRRLSYKLLRGVTNVADRMLLLEKMDVIYRKALETPGDHAFTQKALDVMNISMIVESQDMQRIPEKGATVVVANHPFGMIEAVALHAVLTKVRSDVKFLANSMLAKIPEVAEFCILVNPFGAKDAARENLRGMKESISWLKEGGMIVIFPAGEVASFNVRKGRILDPQWSTHAARLVRKSKSTSLPVYFRGYNSPLFHLSGVIHPRLRTAMLPRELINKQDSNLHIAIGNPVPFRKIAHIEDDEELIKYLRKRTYFQANRTKRKVSRLKSRQIRSRDANLPVIDPVPVHEIIRELKSLPAENLLLEGRGLQVYSAESSRIPNIVREIGRQREITFREVGEGTGRELDIDEFDKYYDQLFVWDTQAQKLAGAYRIGKTDEILKSRGISGLYTSTLFRFKPEIWKFLDPALELGRSFVGKDYQRGSMALPLLWKGIGAYVMQNMKYKNLFGPVSISNDYHTKSHQLIITFLKQNCYEKDYARLVKGKRPYKLNPLSSLAKRKKLGSILNDVENVSDLVADIESDGKGIPILIKEYLKLGGKILGFNVDRDFSNVVDGLILVDLLQTDKRILYKYMGTSNAKQLLESHGVTVD